MVMLISIDPNDNYNRHPSCMIDYKVMVLLLEHLNI